MGFDMADGSVRVHTESDLCFGSGYCKQIAPNIFATDADGVVTLPAASDGDTVTVSEADVAAVKEAVSTCPSGAIAISGTS
jgi:ferredoxin